MLIIAGSGNDTHSWITTIAALGRVGYRAEMRSRRANAELPKCDRRLGKLGPLLQAGEESDLAKSLPECHPNTARHTIHLAGRPRPLLQRLAAQPWENFAGIKRQRRPTLPKL